ncbi:MAG: hypothetical protein WAL29_07625 [Bacteroidales bacterium]
MKTSYKIALFAVFFLALAGILFGIYLFNLQSADLQKAEPDFRIAAIDLQKAFEKDETAANTTYLNKIIEVTGTIETIKPGEETAVSISLKTENPLSAVICTFQKKPDISELTPGGQVTIRGECSGILMDILLNNCVIVQDK